MGTASRFPRDYITQKSGLTFCVLMVLHGTNCKFVPCSFLKHYWLLIDVGVSCALH